MSSIIPGAYAMSMNKTKKLVLNDLTFQGKREGIDIFQKGMSMLEDNKSCENSNSQAG